MSGQSGPEPSNDDLLEELRIQRKLRTYFYALDARDREALETVFADDVTVQYHTGTEGQFTQEGAKNIVDYLIGNMGNYRTRTHIGANHHIAIVGDKATTTTHAVATLWKGDRLVVRGLRYVDEFVRMDGDWRIKTRKHAPMWQFNTQPSEPDIPAPALAVAAAQRAGRKA
jgi:hypothetical protein